MSYPLYPMNALRARTPLSSSLKEDLFSPTPFLTKWVSLIAWRFAILWSYARRSAHVLQGMYCHLPTSESLILTEPQQLSEDSRKAYGTRAPLILEQRFHRTALLPSHIPSEDVLVGRHGVPVVVREAAPFINEACLPAGFHSPQGQVAAFTVLRFRS